MHAIRRTALAALALGLTTVGLMTIPPVLAAGPQSSTRIASFYALSPAWVELRVVNQGQSLAPYVPTPQEVVDRMLQLAEVTENDVVYDLGSGDGRIPITAAKTYGARGVGVDIDPDRIAESNANARREGVEHLVEFIQMDAMDVDVSGATVVTLYLLSSSNLKLRPILTSQLPVGARIVSHAFSMGDWQADTVESFQDSRGNPRTLYLWKFDGQHRP